MAEALEGWASIPRAIQRDSTVSGTAKLVYLALSSRANANLEAWPSVRMIAAEASCSTSSAQRALKELRARGYLSWIGQTRRDNAGQTSNLYRLHPTAGPPDGGGRPAGPGVSVPLTDERESGEREPKNDRKSAPGGSRRATTKQLRFLLDQYLIINSGEQPDEVERAEWRSLTVLEADSMISEYWRTIEGDKHALLADAQARFPHLLSEEALAYVVRELAR